MNYLFPALLIIFIISTFQISKEQSTSLNMANWMSNLPDDKKILLINIPGTHNTAANVLHPLGESVARTQNRTIPELLRFGVRKLDIRVTIRELLEGDDDDSDLSTCHGMFDCYFIDENNVTKNLTFKHILLDIKDFLEEYPTETVIVWTQSEKGDSYQNYKRAIELFEKLVGDIFVKFDKNLKLGDVRGKIVSTTYKTDLIDSEGKPIYHFGIDGGTDLEEIHRKFIDYYYNTWEVTGQLKVEEVKEFLRTYDLSIKEVEKEFEKKIDDYPISYSVACTGEHQSILPFPKIQADIVNPFILGYDFKKGNYYGWIDMDFASLELAKTLIDTNF